MISKLMAGVLALGLALFLLVLVALKVGEIALWVVILIGVTMMVVDFVQGMREDEA